MEYRSLAASLWPGSGAAWASTQGASLPRGLEVADEGADDADVYVVSVLVDVLVPSDPDEGGEAVGGGVVGR